MLLVGVEYLLALAAGSLFEGKMVINDRGAVFGPVSTQHRDLRADGIAYADAYKGNAVAAMLAPKRIELRFHQAFTDEHVTALLQTLAAQPDLAFVVTWQATYQGRRLVIG